MKIFNLRFIYLAKDQVCFSSDSAKAEKTGAEKTGVKIILQKKLAQYFLSTSNYSKSTLSI